MRPLKIFRSLRLLLAVGLVTAASAQNPSQPVKAELIAVKSESFSQSVSATGTLRANESVILVPEISKRLVKISVTEGADVAANELLFKLDDSELRAEMAELDARLKLSQSNKERASRLLPSNAISHEQFDALASAVTVLEAQRATLEVQISKTEIRAPFAGRVGLRNVSEGALVSPSTPLIALQDISRIKVDFPLPEHYAGQVKQGQKFTFTVAGNGTVFDGKVSVLEPAIDPATRSLLVRGLCENPKGLMPGGFAEVTLTLEGSSEGVVVPTQAIVPSARGQGVFVIENGKARLQVIQIGVRTEDRVQILRGLKEGDLVASTNLQRIRPGVDVVAVKP